MSCGVFAVHYPTGVYVGFSGNVEGRNKHLCSEGIQWEMVRVLSDDTRYSERKLAATEVADSYEVLGQTVITKNTSACIAAQSPAHMHKMRRAITAESRRLGGLKIRGVKKPETMRQKLREYSARPAVSERRSRQMRERQSVPAERQRQSAAMKAYYCANPDPVGHTTRSRATKAYYATPKGKARRLAQSLLMSKEKSWPADIVARQVAGKRRALLLPEDSFGPKKRDIQKRFYRVVAPGPAFIFVDGSIGEWSIMQKAGWRPEQCAAVADSFSKIIRFTNACRAHGLTPPVVRFGMNILGECSAGGAKRISVLKSISRRMKYKMGVKAFSVAHLDFCCTLDTAKNALAAFIGANLLAEKAILAVTVSYRAHDWLQVSDALDEFMGTRGLIPWLQRSSYTDSGTPMLFATFQKN